MKPVPSATSPSPERQKRAGRDRPLHGRIVGGLFLAPAVLLVVSLLITPFISTIWRSLFDDRKNPGFTGLTNYWSFLADPALVRSAQNTIMWVVGTVVLPFVFGLALAILTHGSRWSKTARTVIVVPYALSGSAVAVVWNFMLTSDGAVNQALRAVGLDSLAHDWLLQWPLNTLVLILANTWQATGLAVILFLVGLRTIPPETLEAGSLDGADSWQKFRHVVFPQLRTISVIVIGTSLVNGLKSFDMIWVLTHGGPGRQTETFAVSMYQETFLSLRPGAGAAIAVMLTVIVLAASWLYLHRQLSRKGA